VVVDLADLKQLGLRLQLGPTGLFWYEEEVLGLVLVRVVGTGTDVFAFAAGYAPPCT